MKDALFEKLKSEKKFIIATHISPDADAISSSVGLAILLRTLGKEVKVFYEEPLPEKFLKLVDATLIINTEKDLESIISTSVLVGVDCATKKRLGEVVNKHFSSAVFTLNIDHHESNELWASLNWVIKDAPATAYMIYLLSKEIGVKLTHQQSNLLYSGIMDDTGCFRYSNTTKECLAVCAELVGEGANPNYVSNILYYEVPERVLRLRAAAASTLEIYGNGRIALIYLTDSVLKELNCTSDDTEGLIDIVRAVEGVKVAFFAREIEKGFKVSARSKDEKIDVNKFASKFGGGGHKAASGFTLNESLENVLKILRTESLDLVSN